MERVRRRGGIQLRIPEAQDGLLLQVGPLLPALSVTRLTESKSVSVGSMRTPVNIVWVTDHIRTADTA